MICEQRVLKECDRRRSFCFLWKCFWYLTGGTGTIRPIDIRYLCRDLNTGLPEYQSGILVTVPWLQKYYGQAFFCVHVTTDLTVRFSSSRKSKKLFSLLQNVQKAPGAHPASCSLGIGFLYLGWSGREVKLATYHLVLKLIMSWAVPPLPLNVFTAWTEKPLSLPRSVFEFSPSLAFQQCSIVSSLCKVSN